MLWAVARVLSYFISEKTTVQWDCMTCPLSFGRKFNSQSGSSHQATFVNRPQNPFPLCFWGSITIKLEVSTSDFVGYLKALSIQTVSYQILRVIMGIDQRLPQREWWPSLLTKSRIYQMPGTGHSALQKLLRASWDVTPIFKCGNWGSEASKCLSKFTQLVRWHVRTLQKSHDF